MQASKHSTHHHGPANVSEGDHSRRALERVAEEKIAASLEKKTEQEEMTHSKIQGVVMRMHNAANEGQFYSLIGEAISIHQKGWDSLAELEKKIEDMKRF